MERSGRRTRKRPREEPQSSIDDDAENDNADENELIQATTVSKKSTISAKNRAKRKKPIPPPLIGVVACLSGIDHVKKEEYHALIEKLGGK